MTTDFAKTFERLNEKSCCKAHTLELTLVSASCRPSFGCQVVDPVEVCELYREEYPSETGGPRRGTEVPLQHLQVEMS